MTSFLTQKFRATSAGVVVVYVVFVKIMFIWISTLYEARCM